MRSEGDTWALARCRVGPTSLLGPPRNPQLSSRAIPTNCSRRCWLRCRSRQEPRTIQTMSTRGSRVRRSAERPRASRRKSDDVRDCRRKRLGCRILCVETGLGGHAFNYPSIGSSPKCGATRCHTAAGSSAWSMHRRPAGSVAAASTSRPVLGPRTGTRHGRNRRRVKAETAGGMVWLCLNCSQPGGFASSEARTRAGSR